MQRYDGSLKISILKKCLLLFIQNISPFFWFALILRLILRYHVARTKFRRCVYYTIFDVQVTLTSMKVYCQYTIIQTKRQRRGNLAILAWLSNSRKWLWKDEKAELMTENESKSNPRTHEQVRFDRCHLLFEEYMQWKIHQFTILNYASKQANVLKYVYVEEKKLMTWNYLNLSFVWYKELCRSQRLLLRLYSTDLYNPSYYTQSINNNWIFINNRNRVLKMLGVASNAFNCCVCRACFRPVVLFHTYDQKVLVIY